MQFGIEFTQSCLADLNARDLIQDRLQRSMRFAELPDARAGRVEAEVEAAGEIQNDRFALKLAEHDVTRNTNGSFERVHVHDRAQLCRTSFGGL